MAVFSPKSSTSVITVVLLLLLSAVSIPADVNFDKCVARQFAPPPPPTDDPEAIGWEKLQDMLCRDIGRVIYLPYRGTGKHSPQYLAALKKLDIFKNNEYALNYYLRNHELPPPPSASPSL